MVCIDASNIYHSQKTLGWRVDFRSLSKLLNEEADCFGIYYYLAYDKKNASQKKFIDFLEIIGYTVRKKEIKFITEEGGGYHKGNLDVELSIDAVHHKDQFDSFILFSGDSDFESLLIYLKRFRKRCIVVSTKGHVAIELIRQAKFIDLKKLESKVQLKQISAP